MGQIERLRSRLKNAGQSTAEYRMTLVEARGLLDEITALEQKLLEKATHPQQTPDAKKMQAPPRIISGGSF
jgi:hypothetical protein